MKLTLKLIGIVALIILAYVAIALIRGSLVDWQPEGISPVTSYPLHPKPDTIRDSVLRFATWNVGYGGLGSDADFFMDAGGFLVSHGKMVRSPEDHVERYMRGIKQQLGSLNSDFILLQEVDSMSARSYHRLQLDELRAAKEGYNVSFAPNYINERVPIPVLEPWNVYGDVYSGLASFSAFQPLPGSERHQLPGEFPWPDKIFQLDRCILVERFPLDDGRTLSVVNVHLSAYDNGDLKKAQLGYLENFLKEEHAKGNLVVVGGDWNLTPPNFPYDRFISDPEKRFTQLPAPDAFPEEGWTWIYDARTPTNRKIPDPYVRDSSFVTIIDYFLISPGLRAVSTRGIRQDFQFSDHQPVWMEVEIE